MKTTFTSLFLFLALGSFKNDKPNSVAEMLVGKWEWVSSEGGEVGVKSTPQTDGHHTTIVYTKDRFILYQDNKQMKTAPYEVKRMNSATLNKMVDILVYLDKDFDNKKIITIKGDTLKLVDDSPNGVTTICVRGK